MHIFHAGLLIQRCWRRSQYVLEPCSIAELPCLANHVHVLREKMRQDYLTPGRIAYYTSTSTGNYNLEDGFMEFLTAKSIGGDRIGQGHSPVDIIHETERAGIDVVCLCCNAEMTNEKSILQNFSSSGAQLDVLFQHERYVEAVDLYKKAYLHKLVSAQQTYHLDKLYYLIFISIGKQVYLSLCRLNLCAIPNVRVLGVTAQKKSILCTRFIDARFGDTKLYKSKKRVELRLHKAMATHPYTIQLL